MVGSRDDASRELDASASTGASARRPRPPSRRSTPASSWATACSSRCAPPTACPTCWSATCAGCARPRPRWSSRTRPPPEALAEQVLRTVRHAALPDAYVRVTVTRGAGGVGLAPPQGPPTVVVAVAARSAARRRAGSRHSQRSPCCEQRSRAARRRREEHELAARGPGQTPGRGAAEPTRASTSRRPATCSRAWPPTCSPSSRAELLTPPARHCLPGITRARVLELARAHGLAAREAPLELDALMRAEEVFVTNAVQGLRAVDAVSGAALGQGPGGRVRHPAPPLRARPRRARREEATG